MNRFERECNVSVTLYRRTRDQLGRVDPLAIRQSRAKAIAAYARAGRTCPVQPLRPARTVIVEMASDAWRAMLRGMVLMALRDGPQVSTASMTRDEREEIALYPRTCRAAYHRARALGLGHDASMYALLYHNADTTAVEAVAGMWGEAMVDLREMVTQDQCAAWWAC